MFACVFVLHMQSQLVPCRKQSPVNDSIRLSLLSFANILRNGLASRTGEATQVFSEARLEELEDADMLQTPDASHTWRQLVACLYLQIL